MYKKRFGVKIAASLILPLHTKSHEIMIKDNLEKNSTPAWNAFKTYVVTITGTSIFNVNATDILTIKESLIKVPPLPQALPSPLPPPLP